MFCLQYNELESLPQLKHCQHLKELHVGFNRISQVTGEDIDAMANQLKVLDLRDNKIEVLPDEIVNLQSLERLDVSNNNLSILPFVLGRQRSLLFLERTVSQRISISLAFFRIFSKKLKSEKLRGPKNSTNFQAKT